MAPTKVEPGRGGATGLGDAFPGRNCSPENSNSPHHVQETIAALQRDFIVEALRIAAVKASHAADDVDIRDDCAERGIRIAIQNLREAGAAFCDLQKLTEASDAVERGAAP